VVDNVGLVDDLERSFDIMVCNQQAHSGGDEPPYFVLQVLDGDGVDTAEGLVQQNQRRFGAVNPKCSTRISARRFRSARLSDIVSKTARRFSRTERR